MQQLVELHAERGDSAEVESQGLKEMKQQQRMKIAELKDIVPSGDDVILVEPLLKV